ncbi:hypothetical protein LYSHEL_20430 [Lysobacter helvus]|uniref:Uncharacterized protein n=2 Tax=Lysobacteraceae TaxID=32033 RepID=A0ABN6FTI0_9GAMM|nr:hypothetical protein LYSCAS_20440 [Lysobacter caseinilyticus]BCT96172.1 hypothetical protein LYSHEL_20430 [Lysobacter helvus]
MLFVGGPHHAQRVLMGRPEFQMALEQPSGERVTYCRHMLEAALRDGRWMNIATYAPVGTSDDEFARLVMDVARLR